MSELHDLVDPEARALLNEVAQDPRSTILRKDRTMQMAQAVANGEDLWITRKTGLTSAEKQLLEVWRDEAAFLLREAHLEGFRRAGVAYSKGRYLLMARDREQQIGEDKIAARLEHLLQTVANGTRLHRLLDNALNDIRKYRLRLMWLAVASLRFAPSAAGRSYVGDEHLLAGNGTAALLVYESLSRLPLASSQAPAVLSNLAVCYARCDRPKKALETARAAAISTGHHEPSAVSWLMHAIKNGDTPSAQEALNHIDNTWESPTPRILGCIDAIMSQDAPRDRMRLVGLPTISSISSRAGATSAAILDGLTAFARESS
jgi:hypothetical protein